MSEKQTLILGFGISGRSCAELLIRQGLSVLALDQNADELRKDPDVQSLLQMGAVLETDRKKVEWKTVGQVVISPGMPMTHPLVLEAQNKGIEVLGEIELAFRYLKNRCIGITGTNGKTTVTMLIDHVLRVMGKKSVALGNIGKTLSSYALDPDPEDILVVELSSFQLDTLSKKCLDAAALLNITPDHLDRYPTFEDYAKSKCRIEKCLKPDGKLWVSQQVQQEFGHLLNSPKIFDSVDEPLASISPMRYIQMGGPERQNVRAAYPICLDFGITDAGFWRALESFRKPKHRIEWAGEWNGIAFYDDSKATNIDSVMHAVGLFAPPIVLLAGGVHKGASYRPWIKAFGNKVARIVAFGQAAPLMVDELKDSFPIERVETLEEAVKSAVRSARGKTTILLSPGCSSFDQFRNYEHRGNEFKRIVEEKIWIEKKRS